MLEPWKMTFGGRTHCARMDHGGCALLVGVRGNEIVKIKGDPDGFLSRGYVCPKGLASADRLTHPQRLRVPLKRTGGRGEGKWEQISWEEALGRTAEYLKRIRDAHGARSVAFGVGMPKGLEHFVLIRLANLFGSPNVVAPQDVCHAPREITGLHTCGFYPVADFHHPSRLVILWASNSSSPPARTACSRTRTAARPSRRS
jgi:anaerobic selenocysteine-containing dehydrogenase